MSLVGRKVATTDGPGQDPIRSPARRGEIVSENRDDWGRWAQVRFEDGSEEGFMLPLREVGERGIGAYLLPEDA